MRLKYSIQRLRRGKGTVTKKVTIRSSRRSRLAILFKLPILLLCSVVSTDLALISHQTGMWLLQLLTNYQRQRRKFGIAARIFEFWVGKNFETCSSGDSKSERSLDLLRRRAI